MFKSKGSHARRKSFSGKDVVVKDSRIGRIYDLKVKGDYYQDGTPTVANPVNIEGVPGVFDFINRSKNLLNLDSDSVAPPVYGSQEAGTSQSIYKNYDIIIGGTRNGYINPDRVTDVSIDPGTYSVTLKSLQAGYGVCFKIKNVVPGVTYVKNPYVIGSLYIGLGAYDADGNLLSHTTGATLTAPEGTAFLVAALTSEPNQVGTLQFPQVEQGTVPTAFAPYRRNVTPITIRDADNNLHTLGKWDYVDYLTGKIVKGGHTVEFNGDEDWGIIDYLDDWVFIVYVSAAAPGGFPECVCNQALYYIHLEQNGCYIDSQYFNIRLPKARFVDINAWKAHLSTTPLVVEFELETPQVFDLHPDERLKMLTTFEGDNYITTETDNGVKPELEFNAISYYQE